MQQLTRFEAGAAGVAAGAPAGYRFPRALHDHRSEYFLADVMHTWETEGRDPAGADVARTWRKHMGPPDGRRRPAPGDAVAVVPARTVAPLAVRRGLCAVAAVSA